MTFVPLKVAPGLYLNRTKYSSKARWVAGNLVRFKDGVPQQMGGWQEAASGAGIVGIPRAAHAFRPNTQAGRYLLVGTEQGAFLYDGGSVTDVTPAGFTAGRESSIAGAGFGAALYGRGTFGTGRALSGNQLEAATWTMDSWGETVIACATADETIYEFTSGDALLTPVANAPTAHAIVVTDERHIFALGANGLPSEIMWCDQEDRNVWTPLATNRAGDFELLSASRLQCGARARGATLVWTETDLFTFFPSFNSLVYGYERVGKQCGAVSPNAAVMVGEVAFWMGYDGFYMFDGQARRIESDIHEYVFGSADNSTDGDFNLIQRVKVHVRHNAMHDEVWFCYPSANSDECDRVAILNVNTGFWTKADIARTAWCDREVFPYPMGLAPDGTLYEHERGHTANGALMDSYVESWPFEIGNGERVQNISSFWPDAALNSGTVKFSLFCRNTPQGAATTFGPYTFNSATERVMLTAAARQVAVRFEAAVPNDHWKLGTPRFELARGGGR